jgi:hypothetical protein
MAGSRIALRSVTIHDWRFFHRVNVMESMNSFVERHDWRRNIFQVQRVGPETKIDLSRVAKNDGKLIEDSPGRFTAPLPRFRGVKPLRLI